VLVQSAIPAHTCCTPAAQCTAASTTPLDARSRNDSATDWACDNGAKRAQAVVRTWRRCCSGERQRHFGTRQQRRLTLRRCPPSTWTTLRQAGARVEVLKRAHAAHSQRDTQAGEWRQRGVMSSVKRQQRPGICYFNTSGYSTLHVCLYTQ
jgi:plasmid stabilization system protein ParE